MYDFATYFAWLVIAVLLCVVVALIVAIGSLPKRIALKRNHPQVDAINAASWIALAFGGFAWPIAFVWAFLRTGRVTDLPASGTDALEDGAGQAFPTMLLDLRRQIEAIKSELAALKNKTSS